MTKEQAFDLYSTWKKLDDGKGPWKALWRSIVAYMGQQYGEWKDSETDPGVPDIRLTDTTALDSSRILADGIEGYAFSRSMAWFDLAPETRIREGIRSRYQESGTDVDEVAKNLLGKVRAVRKKTCAAGKLRRKFT